jgi:hypothetical protein
MSQTNLSTLIDQFGDLKADAADIEVKIEDLKNALADLEKGAYEGERYRLNVIVADVERVDWKAICEKLEPSRQLIAAHTSKTVQRSLRIGARNGKKVAA